MPITVVVEPKTRSDYFTYTLTYKFLEGGGIITTEDGVFEQDNVITRSFDEELTFNFEFTSENIGNHVIEWLVSDGRLQEKIAETKFFLERDPDPDPFPDPDPDVNNAPIVKDDVFEVKTGTRMEIEVLLNDFDPEKGTIDLVSATDAANGTVEVVNGELFYTSALGYEGIDKFTYTIKDAEGLTSTGNVVLEVQKDLDLSPTIKDLTATVVSGQEITFDIIIDGEALDPEGQAVSLDSIEKPSNGTANIDQTVITYTSNPDYEGVDKVFYVVSDENGNESTGTITIEVSNTADLPPVIKAITAAVIAGQEITFDILIDGEAIDPEGQKVSLDSVEKPKNGMASIDQTVITYTSNPDYEGVDKVFYVISDENGNKENGLISITVTRNLPPDAMPDTVMALGDNELIIEPLSNDSDPENETITLLSVQDPANGTAVIDGDKIKYTADKFFIGSDTMFYIIKDAFGNETVGIITVQVNEEFLPLVDPTFESYLVLEGYDKDGKVDGQIGKNNAESIEALEFLKNTTIADMQDLRVFPNLESIFFRLGNYIETIDLSVLPKLKKFEILGTTPLRNLDISQNPLLTHISLWDATNITTFDGTGTPLLSDLVIP